MSFASFLRRRIKQIDAVRSTYHRLYSAYWAGRTAGLRAWRRLRFPFTVRHVAGPRTVETSADDLVVVCTVRNGASYVEEFVDHYRSLGATHIVFLDNGSTDATLDRARACDRTTVLQSTVPFGSYQMAMKRYLLSRFGGTNWVLCADIDEFLDYPYSGHVPLNAFLRYLNANDYTAVALQMLDMLPNRPLSEIDSDVAFREAHVHYDVSNVSTVAYEANPWMHGNEVANDDLRTHREGVRNDLFDMKPNRPLLTKHTLLRFADGLRPADVRLHHVDHARIAGVSGVLYHYKFRAGFEAYARRAVEEGHFANDSEEYRSYLDTLSGTSGPLATDDMTRLEGTDELVASGFLQTTAAYERFASRWKDSG